MPAYRWHFSHLASVYPNGLEMQDCACQEVTEFKGLGIGRLLPLGSRADCVLLGTASLLGRPSVFEDATLLDPRT
jgi:hypothetical protein